MKLTRNQWKVKQWLESIEIDIIVDVQEKNWIFHGPNAGDIYNCDSCSKERHVSEVWEDNSICWECFNGAYKVPFALYNMETYVYGNDAAFEYSDNTLQWFKENKSLKFFKDEYFKYRMKVLEEYCIDLQTEVNHAWIMEGNKIIHDYTKEMIELSKKYPKMVFWIANHFRVNRGHWPIVSFTTTPTLTTINVGSFGPDATGNEEVKINENDAKIGIKFYRNGELMKATPVKE